MPPSNRPSAKPRLRPVGDRGLLVELGDGIDVEVNARVHWLARAVSARLADDVLEVVPAYRSLLLIHDPLRVPRARLVARLGELLDAVPEDPGGERGGRSVEIPACYGGEHGPDLELVARHAGVDPQEVVRVHSAAEYLVYMLGFTPGFPYLGGMSKRLATPRLDTPRPRVAAGSVGIAGEQTGIYPVASPGGWRLVARTPVRLFDPAARTPFLLAPGDRVRFVPITPEQFAEMDRDRDRDGDRGHDPADRQPALTVEKPGLLTTVQDEGRPGYRAFGMPVAGAMDAEACAIANLLAGNDRGAAALEMTLLGATLRFERDAYAGIAGADMQATLDGAPVPCWSGFPVRAGSVLAFGAARDGCRTYLALRGGVDVPPFLGSRSTYARAAVGGLRGRPLAKGDALALLPAPGRPPGARRLPAALVPRRGAEVRLRAVLGPQDDRFTREGVATFLGGVYTVSNRNDRMGYQLEGPAIRHVAGADIVSDGLLPGAVQVVGSGLPIVMTADCQTVGGYAKIATVASADLGRLAQAKLGDPVRFARCTVAGAAGALRRREERLATIAARLARGVGT